MLNTVYQLVRPRQFEVVFKDITMDDKHVIVHPTHLSICNAISVIIRDFVRKLF